MSIKIGDKNKIKGSSIGHQYGSANGSSNEIDIKKSFATKHPIILSVIISFITGFILLFSFWDNIIGWIEDLF